MHAFRPIVALLLAASVPLAGFEDPAPPVPQKLDAIIPPTPVVQPELTFYQAPKPLPLEAVTSDWRDFLGPTHNGYSTETHLITSFGETGPTKVWEVSRGQGYAAAAAIGDKVVIFHRSGDNEVIECLESETGKRIWMHSYPSQYKDRYGFGNGPRCRPISDGEYIYTLGVEAQLHCLELSTGRVLWKRDLK